MIYFFDTSALVKIYHPESGTDQVLSIYHGEEVIVISDLVRVEFTSTLHRKFREGLIDADLLADTLTLFQNDCQQRYEVVQFSSLVVVESKKIILNSGQQFSIRTLDSLQLAFFRVYCQDPATFVGADKGLINIAAREGIKALLIG